MAMDLSKLTYKKSESGTKAEKRIKNKMHDTKSVNVSSNPRFDFKSTYFKEEGNRSSEIVLVISGGTTREKAFLNKLIYGKYLHSLRVLFMSKDKQGLLPDQMNAVWKEIQLAHEFILKGERYRLEKMDKVFLLTDVDEFYDKLTLILKTRSDGDRGEWIISNPCLEVWLYYCFKNNPENDLKDLVPLSPAERSLNLKRMGPDLVSGGLNPNLAFMKMGDGITHSKEHYACDENGIPVLFATQMYLFAEYLVMTMNKHYDEYEEYIRKQKSWDDEMRIIFGGNEN